MHQRTVSNTYTNLFIRLRSAVQRMLVERPSISVLRREVQVCCKELTVLVLRMWLCLILYAPAQNILYVYNL